MIRNAALGLGLLAAFASASLIEERSGNTGKADIGRWKVGDCIIAEFAMEFLIHPNVTDGNYTETVKVPMNAKADISEKNCQNETQYLILNWQDRAKNDSGLSLDRNLTVVFARKANESYYGVSRFFAVFEIAHFTLPVKQNKTLNVTSALHMDSTEKPKLMFHTPLDRSFLCANINTVSLTTTLVYSINPMPKKMNGTLLSAKNVQFDAFRPKKKVPSGFRTPMDCDYQPNDIIPIAVGVALAALVVAVLVAYMIGRRRVRQQGYQSV